MKKHVFCLLLIVYCLLSIVPSASAEYMLPYPSFMPGNKIYKITRMIDALKNYWSFGNIAQSKYHLSLADKYLVEAKTLFEYHQYLLGVQALHRSDNEFANIPISIRNAKQKGIDTSVLVLNFREASSKHMEVLRGLISVVPEEFTWTPEKVASTSLFLHEDLQRSMRVREKAIISLLH